MTNAVQPTERGREDFSERLLKGSIKKSYAPVVDIDWEAPLDPDKFYLRPGRCRCTARRSGTR